MAQPQFVVTFPESSRAEANQYAADLVTFLSELHTDSAIEQKRDRQDTQDFGATVAIVLGTASATAIAKGIAVWLMRNSGARIQISSDGNVIAKNLDSRDAARIAEAFSRKA